MSDNQSTVEYRGVPGHPGYRAGSDGSVWSCWVCVSNGQSKGTYRTMGDEWYRMKSTRDGAGYLMVTILHRGKVRIHTLVLEAFVGPRPLGKCCRHFPDSNKANNQLSNLSWGTYEQNHGHDREVHGTTNKGERNGQHKLGEAEVITIRRRYATGKITQEILASEFQVHRNTIGDIVTRRSWKHL